MLFDLRDSNGAHELSPRSTTAPSGLNLSESSALSALKSRRAAFSLAELLVVIAIIAILMAILLPALNHVRQAASSSATNEEFQSIANACEAYDAVFSAYPGPFSEADLSQKYITYGTTVPIPSSPVTGSKGTANATTSTTGTVLTGTQNMLIGLMGTFYSTTALIPPSTNYVCVSDNGSVVGYITTNIGGGPIDYSTGGVYGTPKQAYYAAPNGQLVDAKINGTATSLPTIFDKFPDGLPVLYYRKNPGMPGPNGAPVAQNSTSTTGLPAGVTAGNAAYYLDANALYTQASSAGYTISAVDNVPYSQYYSSFNDSASGNGQGVASAVYYFAGVVINSSLVTAGTPPLGNWSQTSPYAPAWPNTQGNPVQGGFVLISAGGDHIYGINAQTAYTVNS